jgi:hypothetical protein
MQDVRYVIIDFASCHVRTWALCAVLLRRAPNVPRTRPKTVANAAPRQITTRSLIAVAEDKTAFGFGQIDDFRRDAVAGCIDGRFAVWLWSTQAIWTASSATA